MACRVEQVKGLDPSVNDLVSNTTIAGYILVLLAAMANTDAIGNLTVKEGELATRVLDQEKKVQDATIADMQVQIQAISDASKWTGHWREDALAQANANLQKLNAKYNQDNTYYTGIDQQLNQGISEGSNTLSMNYQMMRTFLDVLTAAAR